MNSSGSAIAGMSAMALLIYGIVRILEFYGVGIDKYGSYLAFYIFIFISAYILPTNYKS